MSQFTAEQRLELLRNIRQQSANNDNLIHNRKQILDGGNTEVQESIPFSTFKLRFVIALLLFISFFVMSFTNQKFFDNTAGDIAVEIEKDYDAVTTFRSLAENILHSNIIE